MSKLNILQSIHHIKKAYEYMEDFKRTCGSGSKGEKLAKQYCGRLEFIPTDLVTHPFLTEEVRQGVKSEWNGDVWAPDAINEKFLKLNTQQRELVEAITDALLKGEKIEML